MDELLEEIKELEAKLIELKKEYREARTAGLRAAIEARNEADALIREEMKSLGYDNSRAGILWRHLR